MFARCIVSALAFLCFSLPASHANFIRGAYPLRCKQSTSVTVKELPCSGSVEVAEDNVWESCNIPEFSSSTYESNLWKQKEGANIVTDIGIPLHVESGNVIVSAELHCAEEANPHRWDTHETKRKFVTPAVAPYYSTVWLSLNTVAFVKKSTHCRVRTTLLTENNDAVVRFMLDDAGESYHFGLVEVEASVPQ